MIPADFVAEWRAQAPWAESSQVEQDLVISRALVELFSHPLVAGSLAFRGGTAVHKLCLPSPGRYSEDIDLVQMKPEPIGEVLDALRSKLDPWLGEPKRKFGHGRVTATYRFESTFQPVQRMRLKVEINTREHFSVLGWKSRPFAVRSRWFTGEAVVTTYALDEMLGTKLRALYQRRKGRDLFDLWWAAEHAEVDFDRLVRCFADYVDHGGQRISRAEFEANLASKLDDALFSADLEPLLAPGVEWNRAAAARLVADRLAPRLPGEPWQGPGVQAAG